MPQLQRNQNLKEWSVQPLLQYPIIYLDSDKSSDSETQCPPRVRETQHCESSTMSTLFTPSVPLPIPHAIPHDTIMRKGRRDAGHEKK